MIRCLRFAVFLALLAPVTFLTAQDAPPALSLEEAIARALAQNFDLQIQSINRESTREFLEIAEASFDPNLSFTTSRSQSQSIQTSTLLDAPQPRSSSYVNRISASKRIVTGATVTANTNLNRSGNNAPNTVLNPSYNSDFSLSVRQPLLQGFGRNYNRAAIERARIGIERANLDFKNSVLTVVRNVEAAYYNLGFAREQLSVRHFSLELAERLLEENTTRRNTGIATDLDVLQGEVNVANARRALLQAEQSVKEREDALLNIIGQGDFDRAPGAVQFSDFTVPPVSVERSFPLALNNSPDFASAKLAIEQVELDVDTARKDRMPNLTVGVAGGYNNRKPEPAESYRELWSGEGYNWTIDMSVSMPFGLKAEKARYRQALLSLTREEKRIEQIEQNLLVQVRTAVRAVEINIESVEISRQATALGQRQFDLERARFDAGISTFRRVQESQEELDNARVSELQARIALRIALADLARLEASSLDRYNIILEE